MSILTDEDCQGALALMPNLKFIDQIRIVTLLNEVQLPAEQEPENLDKEVDYYVTSGNQAIQETAKLGKNKYVIWYFRNKCWEKHHIPRLQQLVWEHYENEGFKVFLEPSLERDYSTELIISW